MPARTIALPNLRTCFVPDRGYVFGEIDLSGADARVVAWEADDTDLKDIFNRGLKIHVENARVLWGRDTMGPDGKREPYYTETKSAVHATNYGGSIYALQQSLGWSRAKCEQFQTRWFQLHPPILAWHERVQHALDVSRTVSNKFGFRRVYFDRPGDLLKEALAWVPQSTVAITINHIMHRLDSIPWIDILFQVHDSVVFQFPTYREDKLLSMRQMCEVEIPYSDPLIIPPDLKISPISWGDCKETPW